MLLIVAGFILGIVALCGITRYGRNGLLGRGITAVVINGALIGLFFVGVAGGIKKAVDRRQAWSSVDSAARDLREGMQKNYNPETGLTNDFTDELGEFQSRIEAASKNVKGDDALIMQATAAYASKMQAAVKAFSEVTEQLTQAEVSNIGVMKEKTEIADRRQTVQKFLAANKAFTEILKSQSDMMEEELRSRNLDSTKVEKFMAGFRNSQAPLLPKLKAIRGCDERMGQAMLKILDLAETNWGKFGFDEDEHITIFEDDALVASFNAQVELIQQAAHDQMRLQGEFIELQRQAAAARR